MGTTKSIVLTRSAIILNFSATVVVALNTVYKRRKELEEEATTPGGSKLFAGLAIALTLFGFVLALWATFSIAGDVGSGGREGEG